MAQSVAEGAHRLLAAHEKERRRVLPFKRVGEGVDFRRGHLLIHRCERPFEIRVHHDGKCPRPIHLADRGLRVPQRAKERFIRAPLDGHDEQILRRPAHRLPGVGIFRLRHGREKQQGNNLAAMARLIIHTPRHRVLQIIPRAVGIERENQSVILWRVHARRD